MPTPAQLAENTGMYLLPQACFETVVTDDYTYIAGPRNAWVLDIREPNIEWARAESRRRRIPLVEWWVGWSAAPSLPGELLSRGLVPDDEPVLTGMTSATEPPAAPHVEVRAIETAAQYLEAIAVDWEVWQTPEDERAKRRASEVDRFDAEHAAGTAHYWAAFDDGRASWAAPSCPKREVAASTAHSSARAGITPPCAGRRCSSCRPVRCPRPCWTGSGSSATARSCCSRIACEPDTTPTLEQLGFDRLGVIRLLVDRL
jgi:hypothetical protein